MLLCLIGQICIQGILVCTVSALFHSLGQLLAVSFGFSPFAGLHLF